MTSAAACRSNAISTTTLQAVPLRSSLQPRRRAVCNIYQNRHRWASDDDPPSRPLGPATCYSCMPHAHGMTTALDPPDYVGGRWDTCWSSCRRNKVPTYLWCKAHACSVKLHGCVLDRDVEGQIRGGSTLTYDPERKGSHFRTAPAVLAGHGMTPRAGCYESTSVSTDTLTRSHPPTRTW